MTTEITVGQSSPEDNMLTDTQSTAEYALIEPEKAYAIWRAQNSTIPSAFQQVPYKPGDMEAKLIAVLQQEPKHVEQVGWFVDTARRVTQPSQCGQTYELGPYADVDPALLPVMRGTRKKRIKEENQKRKLEGQLLSKSQKIIA